MPGAFKLNHVQPYKPILLWQFSISLNLILGGQFLLPQRANTEIPAYSDTGYSDTPLTVTLWAGPKSFTNRLSV